MTTLLDAELCFYRPIAEDDTLVRLQEILAELAPKWSSRMRLQNPRRGGAIDTKRRGGLRTAVLDDAFARGPTYEELVRRFGRPPAERALGGAEVRGSGPELIVIVHVDAWRVHHVGPRLSFGNILSLQVRRPRIGGKDAETWLRTTFAELCDRLSPAWGRVQDQAEYSAKVMTPWPRIEAVGRDFGRFLPGLFWINFFRSSVRRSRRPPTTVGDAGAGSRYSRRRSASPAFGLSC
ncbi:MAG: hypothetical protein LC722_00280 [Actinobacteria bacterium]|nr:hypothetical protein [Actinomycetota bacterium]